MLTGSGRCLIWPNLLPFLDSSNPCALWNLGTVTCQIPFILISSPNVPPPPFSNWSLVKAAFATLSSWEFSSLPIEFRHSLGDSVNYLHAHHCCFQTVFPLSFEAYAIKLCSHQHLRHLPSFTENYSMEFCHLSGRFHDQSRWPINTGWFSSIIYLLSTTLPST